MIARFRFDCPPAAEVEAELRKPSPLGFASCVCWHRRPASGRRPRGGGAPRLGNAASTWRARPAGHQRRIEAVLLRERGLHRRR